MPILKIIFARTKIMRLKVLFFNSGLDRLYVAAFKSFFLFVFNSFGKLI